MLNSVTNQLASARVRGCENPAVPMMAIDPDRIGFVRTAAPRPVLMLGRLDDERNVPLTGPSRSVQTSQFPRRSQMPIKIAVLKETRPDEQTQGVLS
ncbi:hypothetical protein [Paraburkholderia sp. 40]|uniref:hypothetical protein n=1 Tax=Paraburkholderia sp. 40 TaxID=2991059 RepID=UPI003D20DEA5